VGSHELAFGDRIHKAAPPRAAANNLQGDEFEVQGEKFRVWGVGCRIKG
jgi:hypothetical protein